MRLPAKPGRSAHSMTTRSSAVSSHSRTPATTDGSVSACAITSQPRICAGGLNRCTPRNRRRTAGDSASASPPIDSPDVTEATTVATPGAIARSTRARSPSFASSSSAIASSTKSASATTASRSSSYVPTAIVPGATRPRESCSARSRPASARSRVRASMVTARPALANSAADPAPITPLAPSTTMFREVFIGQATSKRDADRRPRISDLRWAGASQRAHLLKLGCACPPPGRTTSGRS